MKPMEVETEGVSVKLNKATPPPPPPPPPPMPRFWVATRPALKRTSTMSVTNKEIAKFWRQKRMVEEDHLLAAIKAAARIRARNLTEEDYKRFEASLKEDNDTEEKNGAPAKNTSKKDETNEELRVGIKDWWTKSKYAYLNQPAVESMDTPKRPTSTYIPNFCCYKPALPPTTSFGIF